MSGDIRWERLADGTIKIRPATSGCTAVIGMVLVVLGTLSALLPILQQVPLLIEQAAIQSASITRQILVGIALGTLLFVAGATLVFSERWVVIDARRGEVSFNRQLLFRRSVRRFRRSELQATGVRPHYAATPAGATARISHYTHDVLIFRHQGEPLVVDHTQWEHEAEALELATTIADALGLERR